MLACMFLALPFPIPTPRPFTCQCHAEPKIGALRLVGGRTRSQGRLEVALNGRFGSVCSLGFGEDEAQVRERPCGERCWLLLAQG